MTGWTIKHDEILKTYTKAVVHMRKQFEKKRLSLVFGAGLSKEFGIPDWGKLVNRIAWHPDVNGRSLLKNKNLSHTSKTQMLFHHFKTKCNRNSGNDSPEGEVKAKWRSIIRENLYKKGKKDIKRLIKTHPYLSEYIPIIKKSPITINYNFDDYIEKIILATRSKEEQKRSRGYKTAWNPHLQLKVETPVIYHPNGYLPQNPLERPSDGLVFCEDEFADQLIETMAGRYASLLHYLSMQTCLFIGLSIEDSTLKHLLRRNARMNPGHYHYYVAFQKNGKATPVAEKKAIFDANFDLYNFITLFFTADEIKILGNLINLNHGELDQKAGSCGIELSYCYYITGVIAVGKSSIISYFSDLVTHDEWLDFREPLLLKPFNKLTKKEKDIVDNWVIEQFSRKNYILMNPTSLAEGIDIVDRGPLDPIAFTEMRRRSKKAELLLNSILPSGTNWQMRKGQVILLTGEPKRLETRARSIGKRYRARALKSMQDALRNAYKYPGISIIETSEKTLEEVVKKVAKIIHIEEYKGFDLEQRLKKIKRGRYKC